MRVNRLPLFAKAQPSPGDRLCKAEPKLGSPDAPPFTSQSPTDTQCGWLPDVRGTGVVGSVKTVWFRSELGSELTVDTAEQIRNIAGAPHSQSVPSPGTGSMPDVHYVQFGRSASSCVPAPH